MNTMEMIRRRIAEIQAETPPERDQEIDVDRARLRQFTEGPYTRKAMREGRDDV
jgi:hypothetical protein